MKSKAIGKIQKTALPVLCAAVMLLSGCTFPSKNYRYKLIEEKEVGDFVVLFYKDHCDIKGTTEQGNAKRFLVVPEYIEGVPVELFGRFNPAGLISWTGTIISPEICSETLEKIYFESATVSANWTWTFLNDPNCPNLKKIMYPDFKKSSMGSIPVYSPRVLAEEYLTEHPDYSYTRSANVSYYYNYDDPDVGVCYWIDDCDYDGRIEFIPPEPVRDGYIFAGWYKEPECTNAWDFETDTLPEEIQEFKGYGRKWDQKTEEYIDVEIWAPVYQETILYAKWVENNI